MVARKWYAARSMSQVSLAKTGAALCRKVHGSPPFIKRLQLVVAAQRHYVWYCVRALLHDAARLCDLPDQALARRKRSSAASAYYLVVWRCQEPILPIHAASANKLCRFQCLLLVLTKRSDMKGGGFREGIAALKRRLFSRSPKRAST